MIEQFLADLGRETLQLEWEFNRQAGITEDDDELPSFFYDETPEPTGKVARHRGGEVNQALRSLLGGNKEASV